MRIETNSKKPAGEEQAEPTTTYYLEADSFSRVIQLLAEPPAPTVALRELMRGDQQLRE